jgi:hypothetical protein
MFVKKLIIAKKSIILWGFMGGAKKKSATNVAKSV